MKLDLPFKRICVFQSERTAARSWVTFIITFPGKFKSFVRSLFDDFAIDLTGNQPELKITMAFQVNLEVRLDLLPFLLFISSTWYCLMTPKPGHSICIEGPLPGVEPLPRIGARIEPARLRGGQRQRFVSWRVRNGDGPRLSAERYRRQLLAEASSLLKRIGDLKDSEIVAMSTNDLNADRQPFCRESSWYGNGRAEGHGDAVGRSHPIDVILHPHSFYFSRPVERGVEWRHLIDST
jgi:hypothetical protein